MIKLSDNQYLLTFNQEVTPPVFKADKKGEWIKYGDDNRYPNYLIDLYNESPKHNAVVTSKIDFVCGNGWKVNDTAKLSDKIELEKKVKKVNSLHESLDEVTFKVVSDWLLFGWYAVQVIKAKNGQAYFYHLPVEKIRFHKDGKNVAFCEDWSVRKPQDHESFKIMPLYNHTSPYDVSVFVYRDYRPGVEYYAYPEYLACVPYLGVDREIAKFHLKAIQNGFLGGYLVNFVNGIPSVEEMEDIEDRVKDKLAGSDGERIVINFSDGPDKKAELIPLTPANVHEQFNTLNLTVQQEIFSAHRVDPMLMGVKTEGQLGGRTEIIEKSEFLDNTYIDPKQKKLEEIFNWILGVEGLYIEKLKPIGIVMPESMMVSYMTRDEIRDFYGLEKETISAQMSKDDFSQWEGIGEDVESFEILFSEGVELVQVGDRYFPNIDEGRTKENFANYSKLQKDILGILKDNPKAEIGTIAEALDKDVDTITKALSDLRKMRIIDINDKGTVKVQKDVLEEVEKIEVMYRYALRPDAPKLVEGGKSRPFCEKLMGISRTKLFTREQIDSIRNPDGRSAWEYRGGWYTNPNNGIHVPFCRHRWESVIVRRK